MRLVFISSVTAMTPLRTISVTTGSIFALRGRFIFVLFVLRFISTRSLRLDVRELDHLGPFFGFVGDELAEIGGRAWKWHGAEIGKSLLQRGVGEAGIYLLVELVDDVGRRALGRADAVEAARIVARHELRHARNIRQGIGARRRRHR